MNREADVLSKEEAIRMVDGHMDTELIEWIDGCVYGRRRPIMTSSDMAHIAMVLKGIVAEVFDIHPCGSFGQHVIMADLGAACRADDTCVLFLDVFYKYLYNCVPESLWRKKRELLRKED